MQMHPNRLLVSLDASIGTILELIQSDEKWPVQVFVPPEHKEVQSIVQPRITILRPRFLQS